MYFMCFFRRLSRLVSRPCLLGLQLSLVIASGIDNLGAESTSDKLVSQMKTGGVILLVRHALAPGIGDPDNFMLGDCATQRNLNDAGRQQSREIGNWLRSHDIQEATVYSSQWCRCIETAELLGFGSVTELPALNSFFQRPRDREPNLQSLRRFIRENTQSNTLIILVTHQVTISAITNEWTDSGHGKLIRADENGAIELLGPVTF